MREHLSTVVPSNMEVLYTQIGDEWYIGLFTPAMLRKTRRACSGHHRGCRYPDGMESLGWAPKSNRFHRRPLTSTTVMFTTVVRYAGH